MRFEWDPDKAEENLRKHGVDFADAVGVFDDEYAFSYEDSQAQGERRFKAIGMDVLGRVLLVIYTYRGDSTRLISAHRANRSQRETYERRRPRS